MPDSFSLDIKGLSKLVKDINTLPQKLKTEISDVLEVNVQEINAEQIALAPIDTGRLRQLTFYDKRTDLDFDIFSAVNYAPYVEFGTGGLVNVPAGLEDYAIQFKGKGIKEVNLPARPYFFPPYLTKKDDIIKDIKNVLERPR